uniref:Large ribosomal subunit protein mL49 n=1 Tax=Theileria annulata TaxID=5874 RepID=A0A3B0NHT7_THEAN
MYGGLFSIWRLKGLNLNQLRTIVQSSFAKNTRFKKNHNLPFKVTRTSSGNLAVYLKIRAHGTVLYTVVRHIYGDIQAMKEQLRILCESPVRERVGSLEVQGMHVKKIKKWLVSCGFVIIS